MSTMGTLRGYIVLATLSLLLGGVRQCQGLAIEIANGAVEVEVEGEAEGEGSGHERIELKELPRIELTGILLVDELADETTLSSITSNNDAISNAEETIEGSGLAAAEEPIETTTATADAEETSETETTAATEAEETTTADIIETTTESATTETSSAALPSCNSTGAGGNLTNPLNCSAYYSCAAGSSLATEQLCPGATVYAPRYGRCSLDLNDCAALGAPCSGAGKLADAENNASYYRCVPFALASGDSGYHKFRIRCSPKSHYNELLGACWPNSLLDFEGSDEQEELDQDAIKAELKLLKKEAKAQRKSAEHAQKLLKKQLKAQLKAAKKQLKLEQAKQKPPTSPTANQSSASSMASSEEN